MSRPSRSAISHSPSNSTYSARSSAAMNLASGSNLCGYAYGSERLRITSVIVDAIDERTAGASAVIAPAASACEQGGSAQGSEGVAADTKAGGEVLASAASDGSRATELKLATARTVGSVKHGQAADPPAIAGATGEWDKRAADGLLTSAAVATTYCALGRVRDVAGEIAVGSTRRFDKPKFRAVPVMASTKDVWVPCDRLPLVRTSEPETLRAGTFGGGASYKGRSPRVWLVPQLLWCPRGRQLRH